MPSPRGTNNAGLFLPSGSRAAVAYDAAPDDGEPMDYTAVIEFLSNKLERADLVKVCRMLGLDDEASGASDAARRNAYAADARALHRRGHINDQELSRRIMYGPPHHQTEAEAAAFAERFPHAARLKVL